MKNYTVEFNSNTKGIKLFFKNRYLTINADKRRDWDYDHLERYLGDYKYLISKSVLEKFKGNDRVITALKNMIEADTCLKVDNNKSERYTGRNQYIVCKFPLYILREFKNLFISSLVYEEINNESKGKKDYVKVCTPEPEIAEFEFNPTDRTVTLTDLALYEPVDNPYYKYARKAIETSSVEAIGLDKYSTDKNKDVKDFYNRQHMSKWKTVDQLDLESDTLNCPGVYMLYDEVRDTFYVGKAIRLKERIQQHRKPAKDKEDKEPIQFFTHYRYSAISLEYLEFLFLIENAAIHDLAWFIDMPRAGKYTPSLSKVMKWDTCKMVNTAEHQTRKQ